MKTGVLVSNILAAGNLNGRQRLTYKGPLIGAEIEISNHRHADWSDDWDIHDEPSIGPNGREYVFREPRKLQEAERAVRGLYEQLTAAKATTDDRSGIHFHLNVSDLTLDDVKHLVFLYCIAEPTIFHLMPERRGKIFCVPLEHSVQYMDSITYALVRTRAEDAAALFRHMVNNRYSALNLAPIYKFGSVEFRMFPSTLDVNEILRWMRCVVRLGEAGRAFTGDYISTIQRCSYDPEGVLSSIFPSEIIQPLIEGGMLGPLAMQGARIATDFVTKLNINQNGNELKQVVDEQLISFFNNKAKEEANTFMNTRLGNGDKPKDVRFVRVDGRIVRIPALADWELNFNARAAAREHFLLRPVEAQNIIDDTGDV